jgi:hypothetical protein
VQQARDTIKRIEEECAVSYITSFEEIGIEQGRRQELARSILRTLRVRFGAEAANGVAPRLAPLSLTQLDTLAEAALVVPSLDALLASLNEVEVEHGRAEGLIDGLALALERKFGAVAAPVVAEVRQISDLVQIEALLAKVKTAKSLEEIRSVYSPPPEI